jgi:hypothetical protein
MVFIGYDQGTKGYRLYDSVKKQVHISRDVVFDDTWTLTNLPADRRAIGLKWIFKLKRDEQGSVVKDKARLVVKGYSQQHGIDYEEDYAPVARLEVVKMLLPLAAQ